jgi:HAD superfamily hydrolase (TIGR01549 family)
MAEVTTVFFDLGDTLWHFPSMPPVEEIRGQTMRQIRELLDRWGEDMEGERFYLGRDIREAIEEETHRAFHGDRVDPGYPEICRRIARKHGMELTDERAVELWEAWNLGGQFLNRQLFPDVIETLEELRRRGFRLGSITNRGYSGPKFKSEMRDLGLSDLFEHVVISCDVGYVKPHPRIFEVALERMGVEAEECVMVGDNLRADVEGPKALRMKAVWRRPPVDEPVEDTADELEVEGPVAPDYAVSEIGELLAIPILAARTGGA